ncbi:MULTISPECIES: HNH endonuclease [unclassified Campylobacter]|uniref:HNH endonuclease n=1 Tax=unclassified Campylobacter TaxID=2593542 RepID=UPI0022E9A4FE|nr:MULTISPECIES: HNH endonuclease [unclassified Campylobacter]MDA3054813.1 HNH endonuclease [Campylobacter sp. VBCF_07 NA4]MDA3061154.1 HNH endonuclease [Campylobacter sp. VBCF_02 NA5]MDA3070762.1 HNH endonuclease [Campylobacter sp. VBCF_08 NA3]WBR54268.1 hypothetical protein PF027_08150 [Campylobacter sp. VBCF_01 NA2]
MELAIFSLKFSFIFGINGNSDKPFCDFVKIFELKIDKENRIVELIREQTYSKELKNKLSIFRDKYVEQIPRLHQLVQIFQKLEENELFYVYSRTEFDTFDTAKIIELTKELNLANNNNSCEVIPKECENIVKNYNMIIFCFNENRKIKIGHGLKKDRVCRFCGKKYGETTFNSEAHAISEALGNKKLIINDECDECNKFFDKNIEKDFIIFNDFFRVFYEIENKKHKTPNIKNNEFNLSNKGDNNIFISVKDNFDGNNLHLHFGNGKPQNLYKALCKFAISVIDEKYLYNLQETIQWIMGKKETKKLPKVIEIFNPYNVVKEPNIVVFIRKNNSDLPFMFATLSFTAIAYTFIIPFSNKDKLDYTIENNYSKFLNLLPFSENKNIKFRDFSSNEEQEFNTNINFEQRKIDENHKFKA